MSRFLRLGAFLSVLFFATNVFASGYTCPSYKRYTSCNEGYYLNGTQAGNSCELCPSGCACSGGTAQPDCTISVTYNLNGGSGTTPSATQCTSGVSCSLQSGATTSFYRAGHVFKGWATSPTATSGSTSITVTASRTVYAVWSKCDAGTYKTSSEQASAACSVCPAGSYCPAGAGVATKCSTLAGGFYPISAPRSDAATDCKTNLLSGKYVASANATGATSCAAGTFKGAHQVYYGSTSSCNACALGSYSAAGASACTACQNGKTTSGTGKSSCDANCANNNSYDSTWATATWSDNAVANLCQIATCAGGSKYASARGEAAGTLPSGYTQLAYLASTGTQFIDTGVIADLSTQAKVGFALKDITGWPAVFGARASASSRAFNLWARTSSGYIGANVSSTGVTYSGIGPSVNTEYTVLLSSTHLVANDDVKKVIDTESALLPFTTPGSMWLFNINGGGTSTSGSGNRLMVGRIYYFQVHKGGNLVLNLVPAVRDSDGVLGMYDTVNRKFLVNAGSGTFVAGPAILKSQNTCTQCAAGTYSAGGMVSSCGTCANWTYSSAGATSCTACLSVPDAVGGVAWTKATGTGWTSYSNCVVSQTPANCTSGSVKRTQSSATAWGSTTLVSALTSKAGYYASATATSCTICPGGSYCPAASSAPKACSALGGGLYVVSEEGADAAEDCYFKTTAGKYLVNSTDTAQTTCPAKSYCPTATLYYPNVGSIKSCPDPTSSTYKETLAEMDWLTERCPDATTSNSSLTASDHQLSNTGLSAITQCSATMRVSTPCTTFTIGNAKYDSRTKRYNSDVGDIYTDKVNPGYYLLTVYSSTYCNTSTNYMRYRKAEACPAGSYCPGGNVPKCSDGTYNDTWGLNACTSLGAFYTSTVSTGSTASSQCYGVTNPGKFVKTAYSGEITCEAGHYCPGFVHVAYGVIGGNIACPAGKYNPNTGSTASSACTTCAAGSYNTTVGNASCLNCGTGYYCTGGSARTQCTTTSGWTTTTDTARSTSYSACYQTQTPSGCASGIIRRTASSISGTTITYGSASASTDLSAKANYYVSGTSCPACTALGSFYTTSVGGVIGADGCYGTTTAGKYIKTQNSSTQETCPAGSYCAATKVYYGKYDTTGGRTACPAGTKNASTGSTASSACTTCAAGTYNTTTGNTSCSNCGAGYYCTGGSARAQCTTTSGWTTTTSTATSTSYSACYQTQTPSGCASGTIKRTASSISGTTITYGGASVSTALSAAANNYVSGTSCPACTSLGSFYTTSAGGAIAASGCYGTTTAGKFVKTANSGEVTCDAGGYCPGSVSVAYGSTGGRTACGAGKYNANTGSSAASACSNITAGCYGTSATTACPAVCGTNQYSVAGASSCSSCPTDYKNSGTTAASHAGAESCIITVSGGYYIGTAGDNSSNWDKCAGGTYKASHTVAYGAKSSCSTCSAGYYCPEGASSQTACGGNTKYSSSGASSCSTVSTGYYTTGGTSTTRTGQTKCEAGNYCSSGVKTACGGGKYSAAGATSCSNITAGCYGTSATTACPAVCGENTYSAAGASSCSSCPTDYKNTGTAAASHAGSASCIITVSAGKYIGTAGDNSSNWDTCAGGTYKAQHTVAYGATSSCATCSAGYYCPQGAASQTACGGNTKYSSSGAASCTTVTSGYYSTGGTSTTRTGQTKCEAGNYCSGGVKTACGGGKYSAAGATSCSNITAGCYGTSATTACPAVCGTNQYSVAGASSCSSCPTDYKNSGTTAASHAGAESCIITVSGGYYIGTAGDNSSNWDKCAGGTYKASHTVAYGTKSSCSTCSAGYYCPEGASSQTACGGNTKYSSSGAASCSTVSTGYYTTGGTSTTRTGQTKCEAGNYCSSGVKTACGGGKYSAAGATSCSNITAGCYGTSASTACPAVCGENQYSAAGASSCSSCPTDYKNTGTAAASHANQSSCKITVSGGYYIGTAGDNSSNWDTCAAGTYKAQHTVAYGSTSSCAECGAVNKYSAAGASACSTVSTGYYTTGGTTTTRTGQSKCTSGTYCTGGEQKTCPSGYGASAAGSDAAADCYMSVAAKKYVKTANDATATACGTGTYKAAHTVYYGGTSTCDSCPSGYDDGAAVATQGECVISVAGGKYVGTANSATLSSCSAGYYKGAHTVTYGATSSCSACGAVNKYSAAGASACSTVSTGYYTTGGTTTTRTGQSKCTSGTYCTGGEQKTCPSGYGASAAGSDAAADCYMSVAAKKYVKTANDATATACGTGTYKAAHTVYYGGTSTCSSCPSGYDDGAAVATQGECVISVAGGKYVGTANSATLSTCAGGTYKAQHTVAYGATSSCTTCSAGYYCPEGASGQTACAIGSYTNATGKSACTACSAGKTTTGTGKTSCDANCSNATGAHTWATPSWSANSVANLCTVSKCNANTYYTATTGNGYKNTCTACGSNSSTSAGNTSTTCTCTTGYTSTGSVSGATTSTSGCSLISDIACAIGQYLPASSTSCLACTAGYYCPSSAKTYSYSSSIQGRKACSAGTYQPNTGKTSCTPASKGYYVSGTAKTEQTACTGATYAANTGQSSCTACPTATNDTANVSSYYYWINGVTGDHTDRSGCYATFKSKTLDDGVMAAYTCYVDSGADTYGVDGTSKTCVVLKTDLKCNGGYYNSTFNSSSTAIQDTSNKTLTNLYANACQNVGAGYWSANDSLTRTACASGLTTIGYGTGANEAEDCGRKLHAGANVIYLRSAARTSPSLRVKVGDTTFYGALSTSLSSPVKVKNGSTTYSVVNDWQ